LSVWTSRHRAIEIHDGFAIPRGGEQVADRDRPIGVEPRIRAARGPEGGGMTGDMGRPGRHRDPRLEYALKPDRAETTFDRTVADAERVLGQIAHLFGADPVVEILDELAYRHDFSPLSMIKRPLSFPIPSRAGASGEGRPLDSP
jgi:hypothetical protein